MTMKMMIRTAPNSVLRRELNRVKNVLCTNSLPLLCRLHSRTNSSDSTNCGDSLRNSPYLHSQDVAKLSEVCNSKLQYKIVFQDDNIVAINKPQGLSVYGKHTDAKEYSGGTSPMDQQPVGLSNEKSLTAMLPSLSQQLDVDELDIGLSLKSYYSGLVLLTKNQRSSEKLRKVLSGASSQRDLYQTYLAIVVGKPQTDMQLKKEMFLERQFLHNREMSVVCTKPTSTARKEGRMIQTAFSLNVISSNDNTFSSLVEIKISKDKWDAIPVLLSHFLSPVLGDNVYFSRTNYLMGVPFPSLPHTAFPGKQRLPIKTETALWDQFDLEISPLPTCIHRHTVTLNNFPYHSPNTKPYEITAPPPTYFTKALECLGLQVDKSK